MKKVILTILSIFSIILLSGCSLLNLTVTTSSSADDAFTTKEIITTTLENEETDATTIKSNDITKENITTASEPTTETPTTEKEVVECYTITKDNVPSDTDKVYFMSMNDTHGQLEASGSNMGISEVGALVNYLEDQAGQSYIKIINGDLFQGSYISRMTYGECFIDTLNALDFDFMTLGNHEFDWGLDKIAVYWDGDESNGEADFPLVCCNLVDSSTGKRPDWVEPYIVINYGDVKVGVIGAIGEGLESDVDADMLGTYYFDTLLPFVKEYTVALRNDYDCDVVILAVHDYNTTYSSYATYKSDYRLDAIFYGHTHESVDGTYTRKCDNYEIPYIQSYTKSLNIGTITLSLDENNVPLSGTTNHYNRSYYTTYVNQTVKEVDDIIKNKYQSLIDAGNEVIETVNVSDYNSKAECADLAIKTMMDVYDADLGFVNTGGVRATLSDASVTVADIFEIYPFDNKVTILYMTGTNLKAYINKNSGLYFNADFDKSSIDESKTYKIVTMDFVAKYGNSYIKSYCVGNDYTVLNDILRDVLVDYLRNN